MKKLRSFLWRILGIDYSRALKIHDYVFLQNDKFTTIGRGTYDNGALVFRWTNAPLAIGRYCSIANGVRFIMDEGYHGSSQITSYPLLNNLYKNTSTPENLRKLETQINQKMGITIGHDVWIGMGAYIMPGVKIGNGVTIAANAVVTKDIPNYTIAAGVPAKIIKHKFDNDTINQLNEIEWWNWEERILKERVLDFYKSPKDFINTYKND